MDGRGILTADPADLLQGLLDGYHPVLRTPKLGQAVVDFDQPIGEFWSRQAGVPQLVGPTNYGSVMFGKNGTHIVPANPIQW
jgi:filamentous hemagglutinin